MAQELDPTLDPSTTSVAYNTMVPRFHKMETLLGGTEAMREAGTEYLPEHPEEQPKRYNERLAAATLLNITELTLDSLVGRPFSDPVKLNDDVPEQIVTVLDNVDLQGNNLDVFARQWFKEGLAKGFAHALIEFPRKPEVAVGEPPRTLADDTKAGARPYWVFIKPENLIFAHTELINGVETVTHARILEETTVRVGFAEVWQTKIRVIEPGIQRIFLKVVDEKTDEVTWVLDEEFEFDLSFVPLVTFYAEKDGPFNAKPPLGDLGDLNIAHWQSCSDQRQILTVARFPMLAASGADQEQTKMVVGPFSWLSSPDAQGRFYYVEHSGKSIAAGRQDLLDLEEQMAHYGAEFLTKRPGRETATARALDSAEATSPLQDMTIRFMDAVNQALFITAQWLKLPDGGTVEIATDFGPENPDQSDMNVLKFTRNRNDISRKNYLRELKRRGILPDDFDIDEDQTFIEKEVLDGLSSLELDEGEDEGSGEIGKTGTGDSGDGGSGA
jgi:hypothetical protein